MAFSNLLTHSITVQRATPTLGVRKTYQDTGTPIPCLIQPGGQPGEAVATPQTGGAFGNSFKCFVGIGADVLDGDQVTDQDGDKYFVRGIREYKYGNFPHLILALESDKRP
jgi:hypothetical protein